MDDASNRKKIPNPRQNANILSTLTFFFTLPLFFKGYKKEFDVDDLYETLKEHKSSLIGDKLEAAWNGEQEKAAKWNRNPCLAKALLRTFGLEYLAFGVVLAFNEIVVKLVPPICLAQLISYYSSAGEADITEFQAYMYAVGIIVCSLVGVIIHHPYTMVIFHTGMKLRVASCSLIYRKTLRLSKRALSQTNVGHLVNMLSNDVNRFDYCVGSLHFLWVAPLQTMIVMYLIHREVGISAVIGTLTLVAFTPLQLFFGKLSSMYRRQIAHKTDERIRLMNEIILGIQIIKMYTWEKPFTKLLSLSRRDEIKLIKVVSYIRAVYTSLTTFTHRIALYATILALIFFGNDVNAQEVYMLTCFYNILRLSVTICFYQGVFSLAEVKVSVERLNKFLLFDEAELLKEDSKTCSNRLTEEEEIDALPVNAITINNGTLKWAEASKDNTLTNLNLNIERGSLVAVIGHVGCGKSSLLYGILKELALIEGTLEVYGTVSYASQDSWLFSNSARQNIIFGEAIDAVRYKTVVEVTALEKDFAILPYGDKTLVGERGVILSGGQRARINLARALYKDADIYLLDDPLSAVDTHVGKQIFENCIRGFLQEKTVILVTHQLQYLKDVDYIVILEQGSLRAEGTFADLQKSGLDFTKFLKKEYNKTEDEYTEKLALSNMPLEKNLSDVSTDFVQKPSDPRSEKEQRSGGYISAHVYKGYLTAGANCCMIFILALWLIFTQLIVSLTDYFIAYWMNLEQKESAEADCSTALEDVFAGIVANSTENRNTTNDTQEYYLLEFTSETLIYIYSGLTLAIIAFSLIRAITFFSICMKASVKLHDTMCQSLVHASMRFFNTNASGRILNRCSKDMGFIDERLPPTLVEYIQIALALLGILGVIVAANPWMLIPSVAICLIFYLLTIFYLKTALVLKRLEGVTRSPVFTHISASIQGLTTIRALRAQAVLEKEFDNHQDLHSSAWYSFHAVSATFGYWLDIVCVIYIAAVTMNFFFIGNEQSGGNVGLAISQALLLTGMLQWGVRQGTEVENHMTSVERVLEYTRIEQEPVLDSSLDKKPRKTWPERGEIQFANLSFSYFPEGIPVLQCLNFTINSLEKVGIVGRTGAGKSSLIAALFRFSEPDGSIVIDGIDIKELGLHDLRSKITIIPQKPILFSGTLKENLDPLAEHDDEVLWKVLEEVELKQVVTDLVTGLHSKILEGGTNFSVGQRQLLCLARAILRNNKILILDEVTANVDPYTDILIQQTIKRRFANCTVLTIAHRLHTVMDSDKVLVIDNGSIVEYDHPYLLLQNPIGALSGLVLESGKAMEDVLRKVAKDSYEHLQLKNNK